MFPGTRGYNRRERERVGETSASPSPGFSTKNVRYSSDKAEKKRWPRRSQVTFIQARRGDSRPNDQAEHEMDQGGFIFKGRFVEAIREMLDRQDVLGIL